jgi:predicted MFS family arabinose efflux permease
VAPYGGTTADDVDPVRSGAARLAVRTLATAARTKGFWYLAGGMIICGATTMGLIQPHFIPAAHDHGMPQTVAAGLLALVGIFDVAGTIASGWLTDRVDPRYLLLVYYVLRGLSLLALPALFGPDIQASMVAFIVFYGLDWVATIPPTMALCRELFGAAAPVVFGWVFASHQVGAAAMALGAGIVRDELGAYDAAWYVGGALCVVAGLLSLLVRARRTAPVLQPQP